MNSTVLLPSCESRRYDGSERKTKKQCEASVRTQGKEIFPGEPWRERSGGRSPPVKFSTSPAPRSRREPGQVSGLAAVTFAEPTNPLTLVTFTRARRIRAEVDRRRGGGGA